MSVTRLPAAPVAALEYCDQNVSPVAVSTYWWSIVWLGPSVRAAALSQSLPAAYTSDASPVVLSETLGAPLAAPPVADAPMPIECSNEITASDWS